MRKVGSVGRFGMIVSAYELFVRVCLCFHSLQGLDHLDKVPFKLGDLGLLDCFGRVTTKVLNEPHTSDSIGIAMILRSKRLEVSLIKNEILIAASLSDVGPHVGLPTFESVLRSHSSYHSENY